VTPATEHELEVPVLVKDLDIAISRGIGYDESLIYPTRMNFVNHNHDGKQSCGPANWALCDAEEDTALMRYSWYESHTNISNLTANVATWSPELIASQLDHPELRECMTGNGANADLATENMWKSLSPKNYECTDRPSWWKKCRKKSTRYTTTESITKNGTHHYIGY